MVWAGEAPVQGVCGLLVLAGEAPVQEFINFFFIKIKHYLNKEFGVEKERHPW